MHQHTAGLLRRHCALSRPTRGRTAPARCFVATAVAGKSALITGANTGIGYETAKALAAQGYATVLACRSREKGQAARDRIKAEVAGARAEAIALDLASLASVRAVAQRCLDGGRPLDVLVNNAGVMACPEMRTEDGFEYQLGVNHLSHFLLTRLLLPLLRTPGRPARIVNVSSSAHQIGRINFDDLQSHRSYGRWRAYGQSKLANVLFTYELARRLGPGERSPTVNALHPGVVRTELQRYLVGEMTWWKVPLLAPAGLFLKSPQQGAATSIHLAAAAAAAGVTGKYWSDCRPVASSLASYDTNTAARLWDASAELVGLPAALE